MTSFPSTPLRKYYLQYAWCSSSQIRTKHVNLSLFRRHPSETVVHSQLLRQYLSWLELQEFLRTPYVIQCVQKCIENGCEEVFFIPRCFQHFLQFLLNCMCFPVILLVVFRPKYCKIFDVARFSRFLPTFSSRLNIFQEQQMTLMTFDAVEYLALTLRLYMSSCGG